MLAVHVSIPHPIGRLAITVAVLGATAGTSRASAQDFRDHWQHEYLYQVIPLYDRVTDSTRISAMLLTSVGWFGSGTKVWLTASFAFPGRELVAQPDSLDVALYSFTREGGRWAFARARELRVEVGNSVRLKVPANGYVRVGKGLLDRGRRELLSFRIPAREFIDLGEELEVVFQAGSARFELSSHAMEMIRDLIHRMASR
jgi:hypothetical protein